MEWTLLILFFLIPLLVPTVGLAYVYFSNRSRKNTIAFYDLRIAGTRVAISGKAIAAIALWIVLLVWLGETIPLPFFTFPVAMTFILLWVTRKKRILSTPQLGQALELIENLRSMQSDITRATLHIELLATELQSTQIEIEEREQIRKSLAKEIDDKLLEFDEWDRISESQRKLMLDAASAVINKRSSLRTAGVITGSIVLNLSANVIWSLLGQPGSDRLHELYATFLSIF